MGINQTHQERLSNELRPMWWTYFWIISLFDIAMILISFVWPNFAAVWFGALVASWIIGGYSYKANKYAQPLPDDDKRVVR